ncbi:hypothetical protein QBC41DRAFT_309459 [Cercophora samala]|uniref:Uncharacterized protein n=1 Tax=Cercophora samala TaxID=330535 RepID=A0AA40DFE3_9PEZI|nr:hypothetical protein QBC41DRAFT_309459 [Cercophora samala]
MAHAMRAIAHLRAVRGPGALSISPSLTAERARTIPSAIRTFSLAHNRASHPAFTSPVSFTPLRPGTRLLQHKLNATTTQPQTRSFSVINAFDTAIYNAQEYLLFLHSSLGIPWYLTIPLFAISLNALFRLPINIYIQKIARRQAKLQYLSHVFTTHEVFSSLSRNPPEKANQMGDQRKRFAELKAKASKTFQRRWKLESWRAIAASLASIPIWLLGIEAVRRQCMTTGGLLGVILNLFREKKVTGEAAGTVELANSAMKPTIPPPPPPPLDNTLTEAISSTQDIASTAAATTQPAMEGILWIPDFALADPYHILPFALSAVLVANVIPKNKAQLARLVGTTPPADSPMEETTTFKQRLLVAGTRMNFLFSVIVGPMTMGLPAAMHLYWITSSLINQASKRLVNWYWPVVQPGGLVRTRPESFMIYPMPQERKQPVVAKAETTRPAATATAVKTAPATKSAPAKPVSRFSVQGGNKEKKAK